jgi:hypothetical protein
MWSMLMVAGLGLAAEAKLQEGDFVAVIGDSITEQRLYSVYTEDYLLMCQPAQKLRAMHFEGVSGSHLLIAIIIAVAVRLPRRGSASAETVPVIIQKYGI